MNKRDDNVTKLRPDYDLQGKVHYFSGCTRTGSTHTPAGLFRAMALYLQNNPRLSMEAVFVYPEGMGWASVMLVHEDGAAA